jgi:hypothetical protein
VTQSAKVIAHSVSAHGGTSILTLEIHIWRPLLAELNTHRALSNLSGSAASSRAVPAAKRIAAVRENPYTPSHWPENQAGMIGKLGPVDVREWTGRFLECRQIWREAAEMACYHAEKLAETGTHKANINRILEPFHTVPVVLTGTEDGWENFFALRTERQEDGTPVPDPEFCDLADEMLRAARASLPASLYPVEWHLPYVPFEETFKGGIDDAKACSAARCARVSYENHDGQRDIAKDIALHDRLLASGHMSPMEHQARPRTYQDGDWAGQNGNLHPDWVQYRKTLTGERRTFKIWETK